MKARKLRVRFGLIYAEAILGHRFVVFFRVNVGVEALACLRGVALGAARFTFILGEVVFKKFARSISHALIFHDRVVPERNDLQPDVPMGP